MQPLAVQLKAITTVSSAIRFGEKSPGAAIPVDGREAANAEALRPGMGN
jgi:hypothetical protein